VSQTKHLAASLEAATGEVLPLEGGHPPPRAVAPVRQGESRRERWVHALLQGLANFVVQKPRAEKLRFGLVKNPEELAAVGQMRLRVYQAKLPYLLRELSEDGTDSYDANSFVFAVWRGAQVVATIRATRYPYETLRYVPEPELSRWLERGWNTDYLEWGRLLVDTTPGINRLTPAMLTYAGLHLFWLTAYRKYFGYSKPQVRRAFGGFRLGQDSLSFKIPHRGDHSYLLLKGDFLAGVVFAAPRWLGAVVRGFLGAARGSGRKHRKSVTLEKQVRE
jgi:hypothetical protein